MAKLQINYKTFKNSTDHNQVHSWAQLNRLNDIDLIKLSEYKLHCNDINGENNKEEDFGGTSEPGLNEERTNESDIKPKEYDLDTVL